MRVKFVYLAARWARREIIVTKTCRIIKTRMLRSIPFHPNSFSSFTYPAIDLPANADLFPAATGAASVDKRQPKIVRRLAINAFSILLTL